MKTVLVADDVSFVRRSMKALLEARGYRVIGEAASGTEAIERYLALRPDIVTMDLVMPGMNGVQATKRILSEDPSARIVVVSAMGQESLISDAIRAGACEYVTKPFRESELFAALEAAGSGIAVASNRDPLAAC